jgi:hypothetical protein
MLTTLPLSARPPPFGGTNPPATCSRRPTTAPSHSATATDAHGGRLHVPRPRTNREKTMKNRQNAVLDALQRAQHFLGENAALFTGVVDLTTARQRLDEVVASFTAHAFDQDVGERGVKGETAKQRQLRLKLRRQQMEPIALIARRNLRSVPEFTALQLPKPAVRGPAFIASADGMADAAVIHRDTLVAHGLPSTFIDDFKAAVTKLEGSLGEREKNRTKRIGATKGLDLEEQRGRTVLSVLDALVRQGLGDNESLLRAWQSARLIRRRTGAATAPAQSRSGVDASAPTPLPVSESTPAAAA